MADELICVTTSDIAPGREAEFNEWYDNVHLPEILGCPGWLSAVRYESIAGQPKYLAIYQLDRPDALETPQVRRVYGWGPMTPYLLNSHARVYRRR
ncbi:DUF4286 family protein [Mycobacterium aquaticum]|uniref:DUF4286 family protein n=1 Tax=Mycobacterium aquaticum TaxID=1927124 RepID=A0A1X0BAK7_9MYCO|nr:DUF4286 family protein [Mycobacterium aquaticum]ORA39235.1 hypothetical protein BST13_02935 [Mycobacterium aquaticum]